MTELVYVSRKEWGASAATEAFIRDRYSVAESTKKECHVHHTAAIDTDDDTPNRWDLDEAIAYMRKLQVSRPDLGPLPYSVNLAASEDLDTVWVFQARGILKVGAHTGGHNQAGVGFGVFGNFDKPDVAAARVLVDAIESITVALRDGGTWCDRLVETGRPLPNLGSVSNPAGWDLWGHRDSSSKSCPGNYLYPLLAGVNLEGDDMALTPEQEHAVDWLVEALKRSAPTGTLAAHFEKARARGVFTEHTKAGKPTTNEEVAAFLDRAGAFDQVGIDLDTLVKEVTDEIIRRLAS